MRWYADCGQDPDAPAEVFGAGVSSGRSALRVFDRLHGVYNRLMSVYRNDDPWGRLVSEYRASGRDWLLAAMVGFAGSALFIHTITLGPATQLAKLKWAFLAVGMAWFMCLSMCGWRRARRTTVRLHERGMRFNDGRVEHAIPWDDVLSVEGHYVRGKRAGDRKMFRLVVTFKLGQVSLNKEDFGSRFVGLVDELRSRIDALS
jgi:hypothetical protein